MNIFIYITESGKLINGGVDLPKSSCPTTEECFLLEYFDPVNLILLQLFCQKKKKKAKLPRL